MQDAVVTRNVQLFEADAEWLRSQRQRRGVRRETAKEVLSRLRAGVEAGHGTCPMSERDLEFLGVEMRRHGDVNAVDAVERLFDELAAYRDTYGELEAVPLGKREEVNEREKRK